MVRFFIVAIIFLVFKNWILPGAISSGDSSFRFPESWEGVSYFPYAWSPLSGDLGRSFVFTLGLNTYYTGTALLLTNFFHLPWDIIVRLVWFFPFIIVAFFSSRYLLKVVLPGLSDLYSSIGALLFLTNTYILMVVGGGQIGVGLSYGIAPLVLASFMRIADYDKLRIADYALRIRYSIIAGLVFSVQIMLDPRIAYVTIAAAILYLLFNYVLRIANGELQIKSVIRNKQLNIWGIIYALIIPLGITGLLHAFWLLPFLFVGSGSIDQLGGVYTTAGAVKFFSFAKLENSLSLLHPNWPENLFGKVSFMKAEFLALPILAYASLLFIGRKTSDLRHQRSIILFFALLGLIGAFLAKGANDPFGFLYIWLFEHVPGFVMFRDPTKWYLLIALSYSVLIPYSVYSIYEWLKHKLED